MLRKLTQLFHKFASPKYFYMLTSKMLPYLNITTLVLLCIGLVWGLAFAPVDYLQGNSYRIIFIHVPTSFLAQALYLSIAVASIIFLVWKIKLAAIFSQAAIVVGLVMTIISLLTGAIWGRPTWGAYWVWDARLTSMLILLFFYIGLFALYNASNSKDNANKICAIMAIIGAINIPIIKYSVVWWSSLHQGVTISVSKGSKMAIEMLIPLLICIIAFYLLATIIVIIRMQAGIVEQNWQQNWVKELINQQG